MSLLKSIVVGMLVGLLAGIASFYAVAPLFGSDFAALCDFAVAMVVSCGLSLWLSLR